MGYKFTEENSILADLVDPGDLIIIQDPKVRMMEMRIVVEVLQAITWEDGIELLVKHKDREFTVKFPSRTRLHLAELKMTVEL